jgi:hypothetical protein
MERKIKLSPAMQDAMWVYREVDAANGMLTGGTFIRARGVRQATADALCRHGLVEWQGGRLTDAGREWIAEQIEAARVEALRENMDREQSCESWQAAYALAERFGVMHVTSASFERDRAEALAVNAAAPDVPLARTGGDGPRYPNVRVSGAELIECAAGTDAVRLVRATLADEIGTQVARDFAEAAWEIYDPAAPSALLDLICAWVTVV